MRVLCVDEKFRDDNKQHPFPTPKCGEEYNVIGCRYYPEEIFTDELGQRVRNPAGIYYRLREFNNRVYHEMHFSTLPDASADEMRESERESIVNLEKSFV